MATPRKKTAHNRNLGRHGEDLAAAEAQKRGYRILDRNLHTPFGEIDLFLESDQAFVFAEVKTRRSFRFGYPEEAITPEKLRRMRESAEYVINQLPIETVKPFQLDVITFEPDETDSGSDVLHWMENVTRDD